MSGLARAGLGLALVVGGGRELHGDPPRRVQAATTPPGAELVRTIPIGTPRRAVSRAVLSLGPSRLGALTPSATLHVYAEVQVSLTCAAPGSHAASTHGPSAYRTPCVATKAGALATVGPPSGGPYYLYLVSRSKPKHAPGERGDFARVLRRGFLDVTRYR